MIKNIVIVGGGISGLSLLFFLKKKYAQCSNVRIQLIEKNPTCGGNIRTLFKDGARFECGPNGFISNQPATLELIQELGLSDQLIDANPSAKKRYVLVNGQLHAFPMNPISLFGFKPMTLVQKLRLLVEPLIPRGSDHNESLHAFVRRRFGLAAAKFFADPMVSGIYGGSSEYLHASSAFPKLYEWEQSSGSIIRGMMASKGKGTLKSGLKSFKDGMGGLMDTLVKATSDSIRSEESVTEIIKANPYYLVVSDKDKYVADELYIATPSYIAGELLWKIDQDLGKALTSIEYAPIVVVGLTFEKNAFKKLLDGFGYLIPSSEKSRILGVLLESNIFEDRTLPNQVLIRVMIGGVRNPHCTQMSDEQLIQMATDELNQRMGLEGYPIQQWVVKYSRAIPQYETQYPQLIKRIIAHLAALPKLNLVSNYLGGVSTNDCIKNAKAIAEQSSL